MADDAEISVGISVCVCVCVCVSIRFNDVSLGECGSKVSRGKACLPATLLSIHHSC